MQNELIYLEIKGIVKHDTKHDIYYCNFVLHYLIFVVCFILYGLFWYLEMMIFNWAQKYWAITIQVT